MERINVKKLKVGDVLEITTENHTYFLKILDPKKKKVEMTSNHPRFAGPIIYIFKGCLYPGRLYPVFSGLIYVGYRLVFSPTLILSPTVSVKLNGEVLLKE